MQNIPLTETLPAVNLIVTLISVVGLVHVLQEKFCHPLFLKNKSKAAYYALRGGITALCATELAGLLTPLSIPLLVSNICIATVAVIISKYY